MKDAIFGILNWCNEKKAWGVLVITAVMLCVITSFGTAEATAENEERIQTIKETQVETIKVLDAMQNDLTYIRGNMDVLLNIVANEK